LIIEPIGERAYPRFLNADTSIFNIIAGRPDENKPLNPFTVSLESQLNHQYLEEEVIPDYSLSKLYLQYPHRELRQLAYAIVDADDSNDERARKITAWVIRNIRYVEDKDNYGYAELWVPPILTLRKKSGDCEDGAFLIHSLLLNADVPYERLRTYAGTVKIGEGARTGNHAWTAYRRESDNEWVILDFSYYPETSPVSARALMKEDDRYLDDFFYMTLYEFVKTTGVNRVRDPEAYDRIGRLKHRIYIGSLIDMLI
jgi:predicted transglutaminase-like cysteine proteinase